MRRKQPDDSGAGARLELSFFFFFRRVKCSKSLQRIRRTVDVTNLKIAKGATLEPPLSIMSFSVLEREFQTKLNKPRIVGRGNTTEVCTADVAIRITKLRMVEDVEELRSEFEDLALSYLRALQHGDVEVDVAWSMEHIATQAAEPSRALGERRSGTDPTEEWIGSRCGRTTTRSVEGAIWAAVSRIGVTWIQKHHSSTGEVRPISSGSRE